MAKPLLTERKTIYFSHSFSPVFRELTKVDPPTNIDDILAAPKGSGCLMGGIHGMFLAQYEVLRENGHTPSEAFNETIEEATQSLYPLVGKYGMDYMYDACSTTARIFFFF
ncbi:unnamed protein product [Ambrosiozyma monospora]|uniref:Unnamed protein product n=1 Tax=Ambrosiozyma monospora TaxID=43982 RepID=A0ACB5T4S1_AMBMO|nr:unnamed protein product [Ambrosiozyma monospora]